MKSQNPVVYAHARNLIPARVGEQGPLGDLEPVGRLSGGEQGVEVEAFSKFVRCSFTHEPT